ncbi:MAG: esterase-like activity of phytase family protein [Paracoccus sp. (in: a-proteobacteria)]|nr:esterase-like activity of phytase family protein [Paracoccus sp. (in: a-proteobacteria)]
MTTPTLAALAFALMTPAAAQAFTVTVLDTVVLPEMEVGDRSLAEVSGLAFDPASGVLYGVSDQNDLYTFDLDVTGDRLTLTPAGGVRLTDAEGERLRGKDFDAEALALTTADGQPRLMILSEGGPRAGIFGTDGRMIDDLPLPDGLTAALDARPGNQGPESLTRHPEGWFLTAPERPQRLGDGTVRHGLLTSDGRDLGYTMPEVEATRIKAVSALDDGRMLILERSQNDATDALLTNLRLLDPAACDNGTCPTTPAPINVPGITDANFEGLAQISDDLFVMVSDDQINKEQRSVFVLMRVEGM